MKELAIDELWGALVEGDFFTEGELQLLTDINGYNITTLNEAIFARYGYRDYNQMMENGD